MELQDTENKIPVFGVYLGKHDSNGHRYLFFRDLEVNDGTSWNELSLGSSYFDSKLGQTEIGAVYKFTQNGNSYGFAKKPTILGWWKNSDDRISWKTQARAYQDSSKKPADEKTLREMVEPLKKLYSEASYSTRAYILGEVIRLITTGR